jgi:hypothetical protein
MRTGEWKMRRTGLICLLSLLLGSTDAMATDITQYMSGSWFNASQSGHGFSVEIIDENTAVFYWFVYNPDGTPTFLIAVGEIKGDTIEATAYYNSGMRWGVFDPAELTEIVWGTITIKFSDCGNATLSYESSHGLEGIPSGAGTIELTRLLLIDQMQCNDNAFAGIYEGSFSPSTGEAASLGTTLLSSDGRLVAFSFEDFISFGQYQVMENGVQIQSIAHSADGETDFSIPLSARGDIMEDYRLVYSYSTSGAVNGTGNAYSISALYRRGIAMEDIADRWIVQEMITEEQGRLDIGEDGSLSGSDELGCEFEGQISIPDPLFNLFDAVITISDCGQENGVYEGMGYQLDGFVLGDMRILRIFAGNDTQALALQFSR